MTDSFLKRSQAKLAIAQVLGALDRLIRKRLREASEVELWAVSRDFQKRVRELAALDSPFKNPSMGARMRVWREHPLKRYLDAEDSLRFDERIKANPQFYWVPSDDYTDAEMDDYINWFRSKPPDEVDRLTIFERDALWRKEKNRILRVLPRASLPRQADVRRPHNQKGSGHSSKVSKEMDKEKAKVQISETEGEDRYQIQDQEVH